MTTTLERPKVASSSGPTGGPVTRLALRTAKANGWRGGLIVALIALSVAVATATAIGVRTADAPIESRTTWAMGAADLFVQAASGEDTLDLTPAQRAAVDAALEAQPALQRRVDGGQRPLDPARLERARAQGLITDSASVVSYTNWRASVVTTWIAADVDAPLLAGMFDVDGRAPRAGEALVSTDLLDRLGGRVGDQVDLPRVGSRRVVGTVVRHGDRVDTILVPTSSADLVGGDWTLDLYASPDAAALSRILDGPSTSAYIQTRADVDRSWFGYRSTADEVVESPSFLGSALGAILLTQVGFVAAAAFATGARRRVRELGLLSAAGASPSQLRALVRREALVLGGLGAVIGAAVGLVVMAAGQPVLQRFVDHSLTGLRLHPLDLLGPAVLGMAAALLAAWVPARTVASIPTTAALAGRVPLRQVPRWMAPASLAVTASGVLAMLWVNGLDYRGTDETLLFTAGIIAILFGVATLGVPIVGGLGRIADQLPALPRLAIRDSARQRTRSAAAIAALAVVLVAPVTLSINVATENARWAPPTGDVLTFSGGDHLGYIPIPIDQAALDAILSELDVVDRAQLVTHNPYISDDGPSIGYADDGDGPGVQYGLSLGLLTEDLARVTGLEAELSGLPTGTVLLTHALHGNGWRTGLTVSTPADDGAMRPTDQVLPTRSLDRSLGDAAAGLPSALITPATAQQLGLDLALARSAEVVRLAEPIGLAQWREVQAQAQDAPGRMWVDGGPTSQLPLPWPALALLASLAAALLIQGLVTALAATESDQDLGLMTAVGATPSLRRRFHGVQAAIHALIAGALATGAGLLVWSTADTTSNTTVIPWGTLALLVLGLPVLTGLVMALVMRSAKVAAPRRIA